MGTREKKFIKITSRCVVAIILSIICMVLSEYFDIGDKTKTIVKYVVIIIVIISYFMMILSGLIYSIYIGKRSIHNIQKCDDKLFDDLSMVYGIADDDSSYDKAYKIIDNYYKEAGVVDSLIKAKQFNRLFVRYDFLDKNIHFDDELGQYLYSIFISLFATQLGNVVEEANTIGDFWGFLSFMVVISAFVLMIIFVFYQKYSKRGKNGSFSYILMEYEMGLIKEKLETRYIEDDLSENDYVVLMKQQILVNKLSMMNTKIFKKYKTEEMKQDIDELKSLKLTLGEYDMYKKVECTLDEDTVWLYYNETTSDKQSEYRLVNSDYEKLITILKKYYNIEEKI
ncbi:MAG: hypothetical protein IJO70_06015 [Lachnospiraceae bacterium]|nr:hypothetical protein [Lachnospiraceae bacterium]